MYIEITMRLLCVNISVLSDVRRIFGFALAHLVYTARTHATDTYTFQSDKQEILLFVF